METERLIIRNFLSSDFDSFCELIRDKMNSKMSIYDEQFPTDNNGLKMFLNYCIRSREFLAIVLKENDNLIGFIAINYIDEKTRNLGYLIHTNHQNKGYCSEAITAIKNYCKMKLKVEKLISGTAEANLPSMIVLEKAGFKIIKKEKGSFAKDENGNDIEFLGCSFACEL